MLDYHVPLDTVTMFSTHITKHTLVHFVAFLVNSFTNEAFGRTFVELTETLTTRTLTTRGPRSIICKYRVKN